jgi:hypothetical protein
MFPRLYSNTVVVPKTSSDALLANRLSALAVDRSQKQPNKNDAAPQNKLAIKPNGAGLNRIIFIALFHQGDVMYSLKFTLVGGRSV